MYRRFLLTALCVIAGACSRAAPPAGAHGAADDAGGISSAAYDRYRRPEALVRALALQPGATVADVGAGGGYLTFRLAAAAGPAGRVVATDIDAAALHAIDAAPHPAASAPVETRRVSAADPGLEPARYDLILVSEVDHLLPERVAYFERLRGALAPHGRIAVANRLPYRDQALAAATAAGLRLVTESRELPAQFLFLFEVKS